MKCPFCNSTHTRVLDSRSAKDGKAIRRRRTCVKCKERFTTYEEMEIVRLTVVKRSGAREEYDRRKIEGGLRKALEKRPVPEEKIQRMLSEIEYEIQSKETSKIDSKEIGRIVLRKLRDIDPVGYLRFASVYKSFGSVESFRKEAKKLDA